MPGNLIENYDNHSSKTAGDNSDVNNYRPIAIATIMSKIFELILFEYHWKVFTYIARINLVLESNIQHIYVGLYMLWRMCYTIIVI